MKRINVKDLIMLILACVFILYAAVVLAYLISSVIVYFKIGIFDFDWKEALSDALRKSIVGGSILGFGIWIKGKLSERQDGNRPSK